MDATRILIVEDDTLIAQELEIRLLDLGYAVVGMASSGKAAIALARECQPGLVLMDIILQGEMDGIEAAEEITRRMLIPVIYLTAFTDKETLQRAKITEPYGYIVKPFTERELQANIEMALYKHQSESKLRMIEKWFGASMFGVGEGVVAMKNTDGTITYINRVAEMMTGWVNGKAIGRKLDEVLHFVEQEGQASCENPVSRILEEGLVTEMDKDLFIINGQNETIPVAYSGACVRDGNDNPVGVVLVLRDISEHKRTEELLHKSEAELLQSQKMDTVGQLAGGIAHDFNNELTVISGCTETLLRRAELDESSKELLNEILDASKRSASLTRQLLIFSRKQIVKPEVLDVNAVVVNNENMLRRLIGERVSLTTDLTAVKVGVKADFNQMEQIIMNLVVNARDSMPDGGEINIKTRYTDLDASYVLTHPDVTPGSYFLLEVSDTGCGMSAEVKEHLFEPFFTTKESGKGTGLGLATVYGVVKRLAGHIDTLSETDRGTTIMVYLPTTAEKLKDAASLDETMPKGCETILLVEDNDAVRLVSLDVLEMCGYTVLEARDGEEALRLFDTHQDAIALVVTDVVMPGISGLELARQLRVLNAGIKILYLSGYTEEEVLRNGEFQDDMAFLQKPYSLLSFSQEVRQALTK